MKITQRNIILTATMLALTALVGCDKITTEKTNNFVLTEGLKDCHIYKMQDTSGHVLHVVRCPNSSTSTTDSAKNPQTVNVVETASSAPQAKPQVVQGKNNDELQIDGETYRKSDSMKEIQVNGESYKKVQ